MVSVKKRVGYLAEPLVDTGALIKWPDIWTKITVDWAIEGQIGPNNWLRAEPLALTRGLVTAG